MLENCGFHCFTTTSGEWEAGRGKVVCLFLERKGVCYDAVLQKVFISTHLMEIIVIKEKWNRNISKPRGKIAIILLQTSRNHECTIQILLQTSQIMNAQFKSFSKHPEIMNAQFKSSTQHSKIMNAQFKSSSQNHECTFKSSSQHPKIMNAQFK